MEGTRATTPSTMVITKWLTSRGVCSRQCAKRWIAEGRVWVDSQVANFSTQVRVANVDSSPPPASSSSTSSSASLGELGPSLVEVSMDQLEINLRNRDRAAIELNHSGDGDGVSAMAESGEAEPHHRRRVVVSTTTPTPTLAPAPTPTSAAAAVSEVATARGEKELYYMLYHKPRGVECTTNPRIACSWVNTIDRAPPSSSSSSSTSSSSSFSRTAFPSHAKHQLISVGRLDKDSEGLLLLTNDSSIVNPLMQSGGSYEKEYEVLLNRPFHPAAAAAATTTTKTTTEVTSQTEKTLLETEMTMVTTSDGGDDGFLARMRRGEAIRRGTVAILPPVAVEPIMRPDSSERASYRDDGDGEEEANETTDHLSVNQRKKKTRKERRHDVRRRKQERKKIVTKKGEDDEHNDEDEDEDEDGDGEGGVPCEEEVEVAEADEKKRKRGEAGHTATSSSDKKRRMSGECHGEVEQGDGDETREGQGEEDQEQEHEHEQEKDVDGGGTKWFRIVLREGKNRQIRRMVRVCSDRALIVRRLIRVRLGSLGMAGVTAPGSWRHLTPDEVAAIKRQCPPPPAPTI